MFSLPGRDAMLDDPLMEVYKSFYGDYDERNVGLENSDREDKQQRRRQ